MKIISETQEMTPNGLATVYTQDNGVTVKIVKAVNASQEFKDRQAAAGVAPTKKYSQDDLINLIGYAKSQGWIL